MFRYSNPHFNTKKKIKSTTNKKVICKTCLKRHQIKNLSENHRKNQSAKTQFFHHCSRVPLFTPRSRKAAREKRWGHTMCTSRVQICILHAVFKNHHAPPHHDWLRKIAPIFRHSWLPNEVGRWRARRAQCNCIKYATIGSESEG